MLLVFTDQFDLIVLWDIDRAVLNQHSNCLLQPTNKGDYMNKTELIEAVAKSADLSKAAAGKSVDAVIEAITKTLKKGDTVALVGFGTFKVTKRAARTGRNPQTGATLKIAARKAPGFTAGKALKEAVNK